MISIRAFSVFLLGLAWPLLANCATFTLPSNGDNVVGQIVTAESRPGETIADVGRRYDIGVYEMMEANPHVAEENRLLPGTQLTIPSRFVLPPSVREGIVINLAELRLYYYPKDSNEVVTLPVGIGREGWETPLGTTKIVEKTKDPYWYPPQSVREDAATKGYILPDAWPPGPDNPLGAYMMRMGWRTYLIHGTNTPEGIGKRSSAGCIRMFPEDIEYLFAQVPMNTPVTILNRPVKVGWFKGHYYLEAHKPLQEKGKYVTADNVSLVQRIHEATHSAGTVIHWSVAKAEMEKQSGIPVLIGTTHQAT